MPLITCRDCGAEVEAVGKNKRYCDPCKVIRNRISSSKQPSRYVPVGGTKPLTCERCKGTYFSPNNRGRFCPPCRKEHGEAYRSAWARAKKYGITADEYLALVEKQDGKCGICRVNDPDLVVDHCHNSGQIRGLLCNRCNRAIGLLGDTYESLQAAADYLKDTA